MNAPTPMETAQAAWGAALPAWVRVLAERCGELSQQGAAARIGYSPATVSNVLRAKYKGDLSRVQEAVEGAFMSATVECPALGAIAANDCLSHQRQPMRTGNVRVMRIWNACRSGCPQSRIKQEGKRHAEN